MKKTHYCFLLLLISPFCVAQNIQILNDSVNSSFRGLCVVNKKIIWVSGSKGTVGRSLDAGNSWKWMKVKGFENTDFRDIEAFDKKTAIIMGVGEPAYILKTTDGGNSWKTVFEDHSKGMFLDAMEFWNEQSGIVIGDPIDNRFFIARTFDGAKSWQKIPTSYKPMADSAEACFASSGTNIRKLNKGESVFISGGQVSYLYVRDKKIKIPIIQGKQSTGANSIAVKNSKTLIIVGGDFLKKDNIEKNCVITFDGGKTFVAPENSPSGYRSCVEYLYKDTWITCGLNGVDISKDNGMNWKNISKESFHVCKRAKKGNEVFLAGNDGKIAKLIP